MSQKFTTVAGGCLFGCLLSGLLALQLSAEDGVGQKVGKKIDQGVNRITNELREDWAAARRSVEKMGVQSRVYGRLHWDKALQDAAFEVEARSEKTIVLKGSVPSSAAKLKAVQLARDTVGVTEVIDELTVALPSTSN